MLWPDAIWLKYAVMSIINQWHSCFLFLLNLRSLDLICKRFFDPLISVQHKKQDTWVIFEESQDKFECCLRECLSDCRCDCLCIQKKVVGSAIAFRLLFGIPLWVGCLITATDAFTFMLLSYFGNRVIEAFFGILISIMAACFIGDCTLSHFSPFV